MVYSQGDRNVVLVAHAFALLLEYEEFAWLPKEAGNRPGSARHVPGATDKQESTVRDEALDLETQPSSEIRLRKAMALALEI